MVLDLEKNAVEVKADATGSTSSNDVDAAPIAVPSKLRQLNEKIESMAGLEARGIRRVEPEERHDITPLGYAQMAIMWFSANITANNLAVGTLGPITFHLGFVDSAMMIVFGCFVGACFTAYTSTWGPQSGNRTMVSPLTRRSGACAIDAPTA